jgi:hypothetical protein
VELFLGGGNLETTRVDTILLSVRCIPRLPPATTRLKRHGDKLLLFGIATSLSGCIIGKGPKKEHM